MLVLLPLSIYLFIQLMSTMFVSAIKYGFLLDIEGESFFFILVFSFNVSININKYLWFLFPVKRSGSEERYNIQWFLISVKIFWSLSVRVVLTMLIKKSHGFNSQKPITSELRPFKDYSYIGCWFLISVKIFLKL